jgi:hypothetical protein
MPVCLSFVFIQGAGGGGGCAAAGGTYSDLPHYCCIKLKTQLCVYLLCSDRALEVAEGVQQLVANYISCHIIVAPNQRCLCVFLLFSYRALELAEGVQQLVAHILTCHIIVASN